MENQNLKTIYEKYCESYHKVDDFRGKLLALLPLVSGIGISGILLNSKAHESALSEYFPAIGAFGFLISLGLTIYELKGIEKCTNFIREGKKIEDQLKQNDTLRGIFTVLWEDGSKHYNEPTASAFVYSTVLASWTYLVFFKLIKDQYLFIIIPICIFIVFFLIIKDFWLSTLRPSQKPRLSQLFRRWKKKSIIQTVILGKDYDYLAPDSSEIRVLSKVREGNMAHVVSPVGHISKAIKHKTTEELWYVIEGKGEMWRKYDNKELTTDLEPGVSLNIPVGAHFQFKNTGGLPLKIIIAGMPPWPGEDEAVFVDGPWQV